jgi:hypothetical protein
MQIITLYRIVRDDGGVTVTPNKPDEYESILYRLVADEGKELVKGDIKTECIDTDSAEGWIEIDKPIEKEESDLIDKDRILE